MKELTRERARFKGNGFQVFALILFLVVDIFAFFPVFFSFFYATYCSILH